MRRQIRRGSKSRGAAVVELAVCLPVIFLLLMASLELCTKIFLQESLSVAAYETAVVAARTGSTAVIAKARATTILSARNVQGYTVSISPAPENCNKGDLMTVTVSAPSSSNSVVPGQMFNTGTLTVQVKAVKEEI